MPGAPQPDASAWERRAQMRGWGKTDTEEGKKGTERERERGRENVREAKRERWIDVETPEKRMHARGRDRGREKERGEKCTDSSEQSMVLLNLHHHVPSLHSTPSLSFPNTPLPPPPTQHLQAGLIPLLVF